MYNLFSVLFLKKFYVMDVGESKMTIGRKGPSAQYRGSRGSKKRNWDNSNKNSAVSENRTKSKGATSGTSAVKRNGGRSASRADRIRVLKMKRAALIIVMILILVLVIFLIRSAYIAFRPKASESTLTLRNDGSIRLEEVIDLKEYNISKHDIKKSVLNEIEAYNNKSKTGHVEFVRMSTKDDKTYLETTYKNVSTYNKYTEYNLYTNTMKKAVKKGPDFNASFSSVKDGKKKSALSVDKVKKLSGNIITIDENIVVKVPGDICAVSGDNTKVQDKDKVKITSQDGNADSAAVTYIIYK